MDKVTQVKARQGEAAVPSGMWKVVMMLFVALALAAACDGGAASRGPYEGIPEGKPPGLGAPVPDPAEKTATLPAGQLPDWVMSASPEVQANYQAAVEHHEAFGHIPCYCGCAIYTTPHKSLASCYIKEQASDGSVTYTDHSVTCDLCNAAATMTREGLAAGTPLKDIRAQVFESFKYTGIWTDANPVP